MTTATASKTTAAMPTNIYAKIASIQGQIPTLRKEGVGPTSQGSYAYLGIDGILEKIKPLLVEHKVVVFPTLVSRETEYSYGQEPPIEVKPETWSGRVRKVSIREMVVYRFTFVDAENPDSKMEVEVSGEAMDTQDKASRKAMTSCWKTALIQTFSLITGEPDADSEDGAAKAQHTDGELKLNRGEQMANKARPTAVKTPAAAKATPAAGTNPLAEAKLVLRAAVIGLGADAAKVDEVAFALLGKDRPAWIVSADDITAIAIALTSGEVTTPEVAA